MVFFYFLIYNDLELGGFCMEINDVKKELNDCLEKIDLLWRSL